MARIIEPTGSLDSLRVLEEAGVDPVSYRTVTRRLPRSLKQPWRRALAAACAAHLARRGASLVPYDVTTLYFETDAGTGSVSSATPKSVDRWLCCGGSI